MKKFIFMMMALIATVSMNAQEQYNYAGSSKFTDNWSVTVQGGIATKYSNAFKKIAPTVTVGVDKYVTPWLGFGVEGRTLIDASGVEYGSNPHTMFDAVNVSGYAKFNLVNLFDFDGTKKVFEPVLYTGLGWGHMNCDEMLPRNYMTYRAGMEINLNVGKDRAWGVVLNPSIVWGDLDNGKLNSTHAYVEFNAGLVYHFNTSNGTRSFKKPVLYDEEGMKALTEELAKMKNRKPQVREVIKTVEKNTETVIFPAIQFAKGSAQVDNAHAVSLEAMAKYMKAHPNTVFTLTGYASEEGTDEFNQKLSEARADSVKAKLTEYGVSDAQIKTVGKGETKQFGDDLYLNRVVITE